MARILGRVRMFNNSGTQMSDLLQSTMDQGKGGPRNSIFTLDPSNFFAKPGTTNQAQKDLNHSTITLQPSSSVDGRRKMLQSKKTSSLVIDDLNESSVLFQSGVGSSVQQNPFETQTDKRANRRQTLKIFKQNREMAQALEQKRQEEVQENIC